MIAHTNLYWTYHAAPGRAAGTVETKNVDFGATTWLPVPPRGSAPAPPVGLVRICSEGSKLGVVESRIERQIVRQRGWSLARAPLPSSTRSG